ncbi:MAG TPA: hypothetical protein VGR02_04565 [Thermoanaerobaculia bacterium]|nr:hypothetical protein [Thermoanaerobaculia bacterium]
MAESTPARLSESIDPVIEAYKKDVDRTLIRENLSESHEERVIALEQMLQFVAEVRRAGKACEASRRNAVPVSSDQPLCQ